MFITHNQARIFTIALGHGRRAIVGIGGWIGSWEVWASTFSLLGPTWRAIAYDHRGSGATLAPVETITIDAMVDDLFAVLDAYGVNECVLAAESAGALVAVQAALSNPRRVAGLVLVDGLVYRPPLAEAQDTFLQGLRRDYTATVAHFVEQCVPEPDSDHLRRWGRQILARADQDAAIALYQAVATVDVRRSLPEVTQPVLLLHGEADAIVPVAAAKWLASILPDYELHILPGAGHVPTITRPAEVAEQIESFARRRLRMQG